jgi:hypothetical protein
VDYNKQDHQIRLIQRLDHPGHLWLTRMSDLRGPQWHFVHGADELAAFQYLGPGEAWDMMMLGLRLGEASPGHCDDDAQAQGLDPRPSRSGG